MIQQELGACMSQLGVHLDSNNNQEAGLNLLSQVCLSQQDGPLNLTLSQRSNNNNFSSQDFYSPAGSASRQWFTSSQRSYVWPPSQTMEIERRVRELEFHDLSTTNSSFYSLATEINTHNSIYIGNNNNIVQDHCNNECKQHVGLKQAADRIDPNLIQHLHNNFNYQTVDTFPDANHSMESNQENLTATPVAKRPKKKRKSVPRTLKTPQQMTALEEAFTRASFLDKKQREEMSGLIGLSDNQIRLWFQYRRRKDRKQDLSVCK